MRVRLSNQLYSYPVTYDKRATRPGNIRNEHHRDQAPDRCDRRLRPTRAFAPSTDAPLKPYLHDQYPKLTLIGGALQQLSPRGIRWLLEMTVARLPLEPEFSAITAYGADPVLPTNFVPTYNHAN